MSPQSPRPFTCPTHLISGVALVTSKPARICRRSSKHFDIDQQILSPPQDLKMSKSVTKGEWRDSGGAGARPLLDSKFLEIRDFPTTSLHLGHCLKHSKCSVSIFRINDNHWKPQSLPSSEVCTVKRLCFR